MVLLRPQTDARKPSGGPPGPSRGALAHLPHDRWEEISRDFGAGQEAELTDRLGPEQVESVERLEARSSGSLHERRRSERIGRVDDDQTFGEGLGEAAYFLRAGGQAGGIGAPGERQ